MRLTRHQHVSMRLGELACWVECSAALARKVRLAEKRQLHAKANHRFDPQTLAALSRTFARESARKVGEDGLAWIAGAGDVSNTDVTEFERALKLNAIHLAQSGLISDMDCIVESLFTR